MADYIPAALAAAEAAIHDELRSSREVEPDALARAALEAAAPLLAEAWGVTEGASVTTERGTRLNSGRVMRPHPSVPGAPVCRTAIYGPWRDAPDAV